MRRGLLVAVVVATLAIGLVATVATPGVALHMPDHSPDIEGRVVDSQTGEWLSLYESGEIWLVDEGERVAQPSEPESSEATFGFYDIEPGDYVIEVEETESYKAASAPVTVENDGEASFVVAEAEPKPATVRGEVYSSDETQNTLEDAVVELVEETDGAVLASDETTVEGRFELADVEPHQDLSLTVSRDGYHSHTEEITTAPGEEMSVGPIYLDPRDARVSGVVRASDNGELLPGVQIERAYHYEYSDFEGETNDEGQFSVSGHHGDVWLQVSKDGWDSDDVELHLEPGDHREGVVFELDPRAVRVEGTVVDEETGHPIEGASIVAEHSDGEQRHSQTDGSGWFTFEGPRGAWDIAITEPGYEEAEAPVQLGAGASDTLHVALRPFDEGVTRLSGSDRFATAAAIAASRFDNEPDTAIVATGLAFPDALTGGVAAAMWDAPILFATADTLPQATRDQLRAMSPDRLVVLGGEQAVSSNVADEAAAVAGAELQRLAGRQRFATAAEVSQAAFPNGSDTVMLATGLDFADALAGVPLAAKWDAPVLLTAADELPAATRDELVRLEPNRVVALGGDNVVSTETLQEAAEVASADSDRISGTDRFATTQAVTGEWADTTIGSAYIANGLNFADALAGAAAAAADGAPLLLTTADRVPPATQAALDQLEVPKLWLLGGETAIRSGLLEPSA